MVSYVIQAANYGKDVIPMAQTCFSVTQSSIVVQGPDGGTVVDINATCIECCNYLVCMLSVGVI